MEEGFELVNLHGCASGVIATPTIGKNGNWYIGNKDTGVCAKGAAGETGPEGAQGAKGDQGIQGEKGEKGDKGDKGEDADISELERLSSEVDTLNQSLNGMIIKKYPLAFGGTINTNNAIGTITTDIAKTIVLGFIEGDKSITNGGTDTIIWIAAQGTIYEKHVSPDYNLHGVTVYTATFN